MEKKKKSWKLLLKRVKAEGEEWRMRRLCLDLKHMLSSSSRDLFHPPLHVPSLRTHYTLTMCSHKFYIIHFWILYLWFTKSHRIHLSVFWFSMFRNTRRNSFSVEIEGRRQNRSHVTTKTERSQRFSIITFQHVHRTQQRVHPISTKIANRRRRENLILKSCKDFYHIFDWNSNF